ncbi:MAG: RNA polymerase sigma factor [Magnetospiraceae bacterium]
MLDAVYQKELVALLPRLRRFARGLTGDRDDADDLVQLACEKALRRFRQWEPETRMDSWMFRIVQNTWIDERRHRSVRHNHLQAALLEETPSVDGQQAGETRLAASHVFRAVAALPDDQRTVVMLICVEGYSYKETAEILDIPMGTVTSRLTRARLALDRVLTAGKDGARGPRAVNGDGR